ncbi:MAG: HAD family hydrolase [Clostridia bacterium]|nr:HAD family hydrolase [Clostridia bacterium]
MKDFVFDLYGTLVDIHTDENDKRFRRLISKEAERLAGRKFDFWKVYLKKCKALTEGDRDVDVRRVFKECFTPYRDLDDETLTSFCDFFREKSRLFLSLYEGVSAGLTALKAKGARVYLISNAQTCFTYKEMRLLGIFDFFDGISLSSEVGYCKPRPEFFERSLERFGIDKTNAVYTGNDIRSDIIPSVRAGLKCVYVYSDLSPEDDAIDKARDYTQNVFTSIKQVFDFLLNEL